jgi:predicted ATP-grasp superfamily ATP-dependent carboligase
LVQQRVVGPGIGVFLLVWNGRTLAAFAHQRLNELPPSGGASTYSEAVALSDDLRAQSEALLARLHWRGAAMVEYKIDRATGVPYLMEINGRFWGSLQLAIAAGVDFPQLLMAAVRGDAVTPVTTYRVGTRLRWFWGDVEHLLARLLHDAEDLALPPDAPSRWRVLGEFLGWHPRTRWDVFSADDPRPFLRESAHWLSGRLAAWVWHRR